MDVQGEKDVALISAVGQFDNLYDKTRADYKDKVCQNNSWNAVGRSIGLSDCQRHWEVLRTKYAKCKREQKLIPSGKAASQKREWPLFQHLQFLDGFVRMRKTFGNVTPPDQLDWGSSQATEPMELEYLEEDFLTELDSAENAAEQAIKDSTGKRSQGEYIFSPAEKRRRVESESGTSTPTQRGSSVPRSLKGSLEKTYTVFSEYMKSRGVTTSSSTVGDSYYNLCLSLHGQL